MASENSIWIKLKSAFSGEGFKKAQIECGNVGKAVKSLGPIFGSVAGKFDDFMRGIATGGLWEIGAKGISLLYDWLNKLERSAESAAKTIANSLAPSTKRLAESAAECSKAYAEAEKAISVTGLKKQSEITVTLDLFAPAARIHDLRFDESDGGRNVFNFANEEFHDNCLRLVGYSFPWLRHPFKRLAARQVAHAFYAAVRSNQGWQAWQDACQTRISKKG